MGFKPLETAPRGSLARAWQSFDAAPLVAGVVFLSLSAAHLEVPRLVEWELELILVAALATFHFAWGVTPLLPLALLLMAAPLVSSLSNGGRLEVLMHPEYRSWAKALIVLPLIPILCRTEKQKRLLLDAVFAGAVVFAAIVLYRFFVLGEMRASDDRPFLLVKNGDPNFICVILAVSLPLLLLNTVGSLRARNYLAVAVRSAGLVLVVIAISVTESRMGILSVFVGLAFLTARLPAELKSLRTLLFAGGLIALAAVASLGNVWERFNSMNDASNRERLRSLVTGAHMLLERPVFGYGWNSSPRHYYEVTGHDRLKSEARPLAVHNTPLQIGAELGIFGLGLYSLIFLWVAQRLGSFCLASLVILSMNLMTLPLQGKDFVLIYLGILAALGKREVSC